MIESDVTDGTIRGLSHKDQIDVILHEYDTLRDEQVENVSRQQTLVTIWFTLLLAFLAFFTEASTSYLIVFIPGIVLVLLSMEAGRLFSMSVKNVNLGVLEEQINALAGMPLLMWEHATCTPRVLGKLRLEHPTRSRRLLNTNALVTALFPVVLIALLGFVLYEGAVYLDDELSLPCAETAAVITGYVLLHLLIVGFILYSRIFHETKMLSVYKDSVLKLRKIHNVSPDEAVESH